MIIIFFSEFYLAIKIHKGSIGEYRKNHYKFFLQIYLSKFLKCRISFAIFFELLKFLISKVILNSWIIQFEK